VQGPEYCPWVRGFLQDTADAVSRVIDTVSGFVDDWPVAAADPDG